MKIKIPIEIDVDNKKCNTNCNYITLSMYNEYDECELFFERIIDKNRCKKCLKSLPIVKGD